jgi:Protein of unknown function (DUF2442)
MAEMMSQKHEQSPVIKKAEPDFASRSVTLSWANGTQTIADFSSVPSKGAFAEFGDKAFFNMVRITEEGQFLTWPNGIEYWATSLWEIKTLPDEKPRPIKSPATPRNVLVLNR